MANNASEMRGTVVTGWQKVLYIRYMAKMSKEDAVQWYAQNRGLYKKLSQKINNIILELLEESSIPVHAITNRAKEVDSFKIKIENTKYDDPINQITDFSGIRIIAYVENDLKPICAILKDTFDIDKSNSGDKAEVLGIDKVGYKSIHYIAKIKRDRLILPEYKKFRDLKFEIQIRTILQHAWAEIEHDRNYKFNGVLPSEIKRRFGLLAAALESADREFNQLSIEIDKISKSVTTATEKGELKNVDINSTTLKTYLQEYFSPFIENDMIEPTLSGLDEEIIDELRLFGIENLDQFKKITPLNFSEKLHEVLLNQHTYDPLNFLGLVRNLMIINDSDKYFTKSWRKAWSKIEIDSYNLISQYIDSFEDKLTIWDIEIY